MCSSNGFETLGALAECGVRAVGDCGKQPVPFQNSSQFSGESLRLNQILLPLPLCSVSEATQNASISRCSGGRRSWKPQLPLKLLPS